MAEDRVAAPEMDAALINDLLDIILKTKDIPTLGAVREVAQLHLAQLNADLEAELRPPQEEAA